MDEALGEVVLAEALLAVVELAVDELVEVVLAALLALVSVEALDAEPEPATFTVTQPANARTVMTAIAMTAIAFVMLFIFVSFRSEPYSRRIYWTFIVSAATCTTFGVNVSFS